MKFLLEKRSNLQRTRKDLVLTLCLQGLPICGKNEVYKIVDIVIIEASITNELLYGNKLCEMKRVKTEKMEIVELF